MADGGPQVGARWDVGPAIAATPRTTPPSRRHGTGG